MTESPCTRLCVIDTVTGWCIGCGRTGEEVAAWPAMAEEARAALVVALPDRLAAMTSRAMRGRGRHARRAAG